MYLKLVKSPNVGHKDMVLQVGKQTVALNIGEGVHVADADAALLLRRWPGCFVQEVEKVAEKKVVAPPVGESISKEMHGGTYRDKAAHAKRD